MVFVYKFAGAVIQPLGEESVVKCLNDMANHLVFIVITVSSVALMCLYRYYCDNCIGNISYDEVNSCLAISIWVKQIVMVVILQPF